MRPKCTWIERTCEYCGKSFTFAASRTIAKRFCSNACRGASQRDRVILTCANCGTSFNRLRSKSDVESTYCSTQCRFDAQQREYLERRSSMLSQYWSEFVKDRDGHRCQSCGSTEDLHAHHIKPFATFPEGRFDPANGVTLCSKCHRAVHRVTACRSTCK